MQNSTAEFWAGTAGNQYTGRNKADALLPARIAMWAKILERCHGVASIVEFGANTGVNLRALNLLRPSVKLWGVEVNEEAALQIPVGNVIIGNMLDAKVPEVCDLSFTRGVLIHFHPVDLFRAYDVLYHATRRYLMIAEYYNPTRVMVPYRVENDKLWKADFAGEILDRFPGLELIDYAFVYNRGEFGQDNVTWFLMEKR